MKKGIKLGVFLLVLGFTFALVSEITNPKQDYVVYSYIFGGLEFIIFVLFTPLYNRAAKKSRRKSGSLGDSSFRVVSWTLYSIAVTHGLMLFQWGIFNGGDNLIPDTMILLNAVVFLMASAFMFIDYQKSL